MVRFGSRTSRTALAFITLAASLLPLLTTPTLAAKPGCCRPFAQHELASLMGSLEREGFPRPYLRQIFLDSPLRRIELAVGLNAISRESSDIYRKFLRPDALEQARNFRDGHAAFLSDFEANYKIPREIPVAILLVESRFGETGKSFPVLEVFTTLILEDNPKSVERHYRRLKRRHAKLSRKFLRARFTQKRKWAYGELVALLRIGATRGIDITTLRGSYAGAFGIPQFLPTSYLRWAVDGDRDGSIDLYNLADSLASIGAYLNIHGWEEHASAGKKRRAVWKYNRSPPYVDAIFAISRALAKMPPVYQEIPNDH